MTAANTDEGLEPYIPPPSEMPVCTYPVLRVQDPFTWLRLAAGDWRYHLGFSLFYGLWFVAMYWVLRYVLQSHPEYVMSVISGCVLFGPFLAIGLYDVSRRHERGEKIDLAGSMTCWTEHLKSLGLLVLVLMVLELLWGRATLVTFALFFDTGLPGDADILRALTSAENLNFIIAYGAIAGFFALLVYMLTVVSIPMIRDRNTDAISAALTSFRAVLSNPFTMLTWGISIVVVLAASMWLWGIPLLFLGPLLGYASWHAYRFAVKWPD